jgi:tetratricopeptide (TPR) repeat protein
VAIVAPSVKPRLALCGQPRMLVLMIRVAPLAFALSMLAPAAIAQTCPDAPDHSAAAHQAIEQLKAAPSERDSRVFNSMLWEMWLDAPDGRAQNMLKEGMARRQTFDLVGAVVVFSDLIAYCPDYAEGWNQRAFAYYLQTDFESALADLDEALARNPEHIAALSGKALTLMGLGRAQMAQDVLRDALEMNPWLPERVYLVDISPPGEDL